MLLILVVNTERNVTEKDYGRIKRALEKAGYAVALRPTDAAPQKIIIEGADNYAEIKSKLEEAFAR